MLTLKSYNLYDLKLKKNICVRGEKVLIPKPVCEFKNRKFKIYSWSLFYYDEIQKITEEFMQMLMYTTTISKNIFDDIYFISFLKESIENDFLKLIYDSSDNSYRRDINYKISHW